MTHDLSRGSEWRPGRRFYRVEPLSRVLAYKLYVAHVNGDDQRSYTVAEIGAWFAIQIPPNLIRTALDILRDSKSRWAVKSIRKSDSQQLYRISVAGIRFVEEALRDKASDLYYYDAYGDNGLDDLLSVSGSWATAEERLADDTWVPLQIDRDAPEYLFAVESTEKAIEQIRSDNGYAATQAAERDHIVSVLSEGANLLKESSPSKAQVFSYLVKPLQYIINKFVDTVMAKASAVAVQSLINWILSL